MTKAPKVKMIKVKDYPDLDLSQFPNFAKSGSIRGMRKYPGYEKAYLVQYGSFIYDVSSKPYIYHNLAQSRQ